MLPERRSVGGGSAESHDVFHWATREQRVACSATLGRVKGGEKHGSETS